MLAVAMGKLETAGLVMVDEEVAFAAYTGKMRAAELTLLAQLRNLKGKTDAEAIAADVRIRVLEGQVALLRGRLVTQRAVAKRRDTLRLPSLPYDRAPVYHYDRAPALQYDRAASKSR